MCQICECEPEYFGEILEDWFLYRATKESNECGVYRIEVGEWFLARLNSGQSYCSWTEERETECIKDFIGDETYADDLMWCNPQVGYWITSAAIKKGYDPEEDNFNNWFLALLIEHRKTHQTAMEKKNHHG